MIKSLFVSCAAVLAIGLAGLQISRGAEEMTAKVGAPAPQFSLMDQDGKTVSLSDFSGKYVVLEWFNEDCPYVQRHYKDGDMNKLAKAEMDKGVVWLAVNSTKGKSEQTDKAAATKWSMERPILSDAGGDIGHLYGATNTPELFVINKDGVLAYKGAIDNNAEGDQAQVKNYVSNALDALMDGKSVADQQTKPYGCGVKYAK